MIPPSEDIPDGGLRISVVGKPNVGKSTFVNTILREERMVIDAEPGTTRDSVDTQGTWRDHPITLIDTAGMRHKSKIRESPEYYSLTRSMDSIRRSDICVLLIDAAQGVSRQDEKIADNILARGKGCVLAVNKWDLIKGETRQAYRKLLWSKMPYFNFIPVIFMSAATGTGVSKAMNAVFYVREQIDKEVATPILNRVLHEAWQRSEPPHRKGKRPNFLYAAQAGKRPPKFFLFGNRLDSLDSSYVKYMENCLRRAFGLEGAPIIMAFKNRRK
jgi:GTP-binding protein